MQPVKKYDIFHEICLQNNLKHAFVALLSQYMTPYMVVYASKVANTRYTWCSCVKGTPSWLAQTIGFTVNAS